MKIIFLDIDEVLNSKKYKLKIGSKFDDPRYQIDPDAVKLLNAIVVATKANIVISSTWRNAFTKSANALEKIKNYFAEFGILNVIDYTPQIFYTDETESYSFRTDEIKEWLKDKSDVNFIVLDDIDMKSEFGDRMIQTFEDNGLQQYHVDKAIKILNKI